MNDNLKLDFDELVKSLSDNIKDLTQAEFNDIENGQTPMVLLGYFNIADAYWNKHAHTLHEVQRYKLEKFKDYLMHKTICAMSHNLHEIRL